MDSSLISFQQVEIFVCQNEMLSILVDSPELAGGHFEVVKVRIRICFESGNIAIIIYFIVLQDIKTAGSLVFFWAQVI